MESSSLFVEADLDEQTLEELHTLREMRLGLVHKQLADAESTIDEMIRRDLIPANGRAEYLEELKQELLEKAERLSNRNPENPNMIHFEELELYIDLLNLPGKA